MMNSSLLMSVYSIGDINTNTPTLKEKEEENNNRKQQQQKSPFGINDGALTVFPSDTHQLLQQFLRLAVSETEACMKFRAAEWKVP